MNFITEAQKVVPAGWDVYSSGGGCYHAMKEFDGKAVEINAEHPGAQAYHYDDKPTKLANQADLISLDLFPNFVELAWVNTALGRTEMNESNLYGNFSLKDIEEIVATMEIIGKVHDRVFLEDENTRDERELSEALNEFKQAARKLADAWEGVEMEVEENVNIEHKYPFHLSFDELVGSIEDWGVYTEDDELHDKASDVLNGYPWLNDIPDLEGLEKALVGIVGLEESEDIARIIWNV